ncbi:hypothetical protein NEICINOT_04065 [Neisseria cinerea ATCC 14685]|uniref:Uncharacterized protein n=1 Tax=Neisseria cinerea ATCC 14685 TaxID=546262 RepID=D0W330_NEICI|nr:hypothetical protein NEICINOT_04065 [Neisseria cinerea ATCC 14685]
MYSRYRSSCWIANIQAAVRIWRQIGYFSLHYKEAGCRLSILNPRKQQ